MKEVVLLVVPLTLSESVEMDASSYAFILLVKSYILQMQWDSVGFDLKLLNKLYKQSFV